MFRSVQLATRVLPKQVTPAMSWTNMSLRGYSTARKYTPDHEWVRVEGSKATVGITEYAQNALGDVVYLELPSLGLEVAKKDQLGAVESVKAASDIYAPLSGKIVKINEALEEEPSLVNSSPYDKGWIAQIELSNASEVDQLMDEAAYTKHTSDN